MTVKALVKRPACWAVAVRACALGIGVLLSVNASAPAQAPASTAGSPWAGYAPGSAWARYGPAAQPGTGQRQVYVTPPSGRSGWTGYAPGAAWTGYAPGRAWTGYVARRTWRQSPVYGNIPAPSRYYEYGSGRPVPLAKPWLPASP